MFHFLDSCFLFIKGTQQIWNLRKIYPFRTQCSAVKQFEKFKLDALKWFAQKLKKFSTLLVVNFNTYCFHCYYFQIHFLEIPDDFFFKKKLFAARKQQRITNFLRRMLITYVYMTSMYLSYWIFDGNIPFFFLQP